jgi:hypothetical protein
MGETAKGSSLWYPTSTRAMMLFSGRVKWIELFGSFPLARQQVGLGLMRRFAKCL